MKPASKPVVLRGDCLTLMRDMPDESVHAIITDPPYALSFMGKDWDTEHPDPLVWEECLRVLTPGGHLLSFGGTRTWHRLCCDIEDAGFEIRDNIAWLYGSGFPKSMDVSKAIDKAAGATRKVVGVQRNGSAGSGGGVLNMNGRDVVNGSSRMNRSVDVTAPATRAAKRWNGWGTALKPAFEPIIVARKPLRGTVAQTVLAHGTGALNIDACRVPTNDSLGGGRVSSRAEGWDRPWKHDAKAVAAAHARGAESVARAEAMGRWPTNVVLDGNAAAALDEQTGIMRAGGFPGVQNTQPGGANGTMNGGWTGEVGPAHRTDSGGGSRFFPVFRYQAKAPRTERPMVDGVAHPTVKPLELTRWLVRLVTPPGGIVLDPFAGSGTTVEAAMLDGFGVIAIEREPVYIKMIRQRIRRVGAR